MHEMALVRNILDVVLDVAEQEHASRIESVTLRIGKGRDVVIDLFSGLFDHLAKGTAAEGAELVYELVPMVTRCKDCGTFYQLNVHDESTWPCPKCNGGNYELYSGMKFSIENVKVVGIT